MSSLFWPALFLVTAAVGYRVLRGVPGLLHTPLMSGMNALSGVTLLGALGMMDRIPSGPWQWAVSLAVALATANVVGGFLVTHRMLRMFRSGRGEESR